MKTHVNSPSTKPTEKHRAGGAPPGNKNAVRHGLYSLKAMLNGDGLDRRSSVYRALRDKEQELVSALGGYPSPQERALIGDTVKTMLYIGSLDAYLAGLKSVVRKGRVHNVLIERTRLAAHLRENLKTIGLKRRAKPVPTLQDLLGDEDGDGSLAGDPVQRPLTPRGEIKEADGRGEKGV